MSSGWHCWSLGSLLLLLGRNLAVLVQVHQDSVNGTVGRSALLPVSYRFDGAPLFPVSILWTFGNSSGPLITSTVNCSAGAGGVPSNCSANCFPRHTYRGRAEIFPENGSLLLRHLRLSDSGIYGVTFRPPYKTQRIVLTVHEPPPTPEPPAGSKEQDHSRYYAIGVFSVISLLLLLLLLRCVWRWAQQQKRRLIEQQQVSSVEEAHMASAVEGNVVTLYATVRGSFEHPQSQPMPEVVYTSITSPRHPGWDAGPYCDLV